MEIDKKRLVEYIEAGLVRCQRGNQLFQQLHASLDSLPVLEPFRFRSSSPRILAKVSLLDQVSL